tara:strand:- start:1371 stop:1472 length:102 start_codon:yes stop_codon:yes gene_type:complete
MQAWNPHPHPEPKQAWDYMRDKGFFGMKIPKVE